VGLTRTAGDCNSRLASVLGMRPYEEQAATAAAMPDARSIQVADWEARTFDRRQRTDFL